MKKIVAIMFFLVGFASCVSNSASTQKTEVTLSTDSVQVDSMVVDSVLVDSVK